MTDRFVERGDVRLRYRLEGAADAPPLVLLNSIGTDIGLWDGARERLAAYFRLLRVDTRGHGGSPASDGDYDLAMLAADVAAVLDDADIDRAVVAGVSLGGMIAMQLAVDRSDRVLGLLPICTSVTMDSDAWHDRAVLVRSGGMAAVTDLAMSRFLSKAFRASQPGVADRIRAQLLGMDTRGYAGCATAIGDMRLRDRLAEIGCPTLVVTGEFDNSTPFSGHGEHLVSGIVGAEHRSLPCGHLAPIELPDEVASIIIGFSHAAIFD